VKARPFNERASLNAAVFYEDYKNLQVTQIYGSGANISTATSNAAKAAIYGLELEGRWRLTPVDNFTGFANYLHATYRQYPNAVDQQFSDNVGNLSGRSLPRAPKVSFRLAYDHAFALPNSATLTPMLSVYWQSTSYLREFNFPVDRVDSYSKTNANLSYLDATAHWTVIAYVDNAENKVIRNGAFTFLGHYFSDYQPPRTFGIRVSYQPWLTPGRGFGR
jgi:iron complex outermembrane receptor protein